MNLKQYLNRKECNWYQSEKCVVCWRLSSLL